MAAGSSTSPTSSSAFAAASAFLHITNGDSVVRGFEEAQLDGAYLPWRDVLFEGPVPRAELDALTPIRAAFFAAGGMPHETALAEFRARDDRLRAFRQHGEVVLWFEHDLTDQLQLIQILGWFAEQDLRGMRLTLICVGAHPAVHPFYGLGQLSAGQLSELLPSRQAVTAAQLALAQQAWQAFCAPDPRALSELLARDLPVLPFLKSALTRHLQEYPSTRNGLSRTEHQILVAVAAGHHSRQAIFRTSQEAEEAPFMGDLSVYDRLDWLTANPMPALERTGAASYDITDHGRRLIACEAERIRSQGGIDRWFGGVHLCGPEAAWRWDEPGRALVPAQSRP